MFICYMSDRSFPTHATPTLPPHRDGSGSARRAVSAVEPHSMQTLQARSSIQMTSLGSWCSSGIPVMQRVFGDIVRTPVLHKLRTFEDLELEVTPSSGGEICLN